MQENDPAWNHLEYHRKQKDESPLNTMQLLAAYFALELNKWKQAEIDRLMLEPKRVFFPKEPPPELP